MKRARSPLSSWTLAVLVVLGLGVFIYPFIRELADTLGRFFWFGLTGDESLHTEVVEVLARTGRYANQAGDLFVAPLTTGPAVIVPAAVLAAVTGVASLYAARAVAFGYFLWMLAGVARLSAPRHSPQHEARTTRLLATVFGIALFAHEWRTFQGTGYYRFGVFGEGAAAAFLVWAWILDRRSEPTPQFLSGMLLGLAVLSKPYVGLFALVYAAFALVGRQWRRLVGLMVPALTWLSWMTMELGPSGAVVFWTNFPAIMKSTNGGGLVWEWARLSERMEAVYRTLSFEGWIWMAIGVVALSTTSRLRVWGTALVVHAIWWVGFSPGPGARYLLPVVVIVFAATAEYFSALFRARLDPRMSRPLCMAGVGLVSVLLVVAGVKVAGSVRAARSDLEACGTCRQVLVQNFWRAQQARPIIFSTSDAGYAKDRDLFLSAPSEVHDFPADVQRLSTGWVSVGEVPNARTLEWMTRGIKAGVCVPVYILPLKRPYGLWSCGKR